MSHAAANAKVKLSEAQSSVSQVPGTDNDLYEVRDREDPAVWNGRAVGDSTRVEQPIQESWLAKGTGGTVWQVIHVSSRSGVRPLVGVLSVEGKDDLAKALKASPIRFVGPLYHGGGRRAALFSLSGSYSRSHLTHHLTSHVPVHTVWSSPSPSRWSVS